MLPEPRFLTADQYLLVTLIVTPVIYSMFDDLSGLRVFSSVRFPRRLRRRGWVPDGEKVPG